MSDFEEKLESILNNPQAMGQILSLAQSLGGGTPPPAAPAPPPEGVSPPPFDPAMLSGMAQMLGEFNRDDDRRVALLNALRPFLKEERCEKIDKAIQIAKLSRMVRMGLEMLRTKEDGHV